MNLFFFHCSQPPSAEGAQAPPYRPSTSSFMHHFELNHPLSLSDSSHFDSPQSHSQWYPIPISSSLAAPESSSSRPVLKPATHLLSGLRNYPFQPGKVQSPRELQGSGRQFCPGL
ncbi:hypothetical protein ACFX2J_018543 [Malus domestica]